VVKAVALDYGACIRPVQLRKTNLDTGEVEQVLIPCGSTLAKVCPPCAERAKVLRAAQCREGWHLEDEPAADPRPPDDYQKWLIETLADLQSGSDQPPAADQDTIGLDDLIDALEEELAATGVRGHPDPSNKKDGGSRPGDRRRPRRHRSTRRRQGVPDLPGRTMSSSTVGRVYHGRNGQLYRPSMFITLTCPSYGPVRDDGTPVDPDSYDYESAARDALHFAALFDRFIQNLRRFAGFDVQYFAAVEPQRRLAPHLHIAIRGTISRADLRKVLAATYHQVWWPATSEVRFDGDYLPVWHEASRRYLDPETGKFLPSWDEALDAIGPRDPPRHVARFGPKFDAQGVLAGSKDVSRCIGYLTKYLVKQIAECHTPETDAQHAHTGRLNDALRYEPCSPTCANWLRYGITPKNPGPACCPEHARARHTGLSTWATPGAGSWSRASGRARPWPTTAATARPG
jgi:hypothetical protein